MLPPADVFAALDALSPLRLAGGWDNVGLLVAGNRRPIARLGLCIDLTEPVLDELLSADVDVVVSYHPPIFKGLKRLTEQVALERVVLRLVRSGAHLWVPHTALDAAEGGMAQWLADGLGPHTELAPIEPAADGPAVGAGRRGARVRPAPLRALLPALRAHLGLTHLRVAGDLDAPRRSFAVCPGSGGGLFAQTDPVDLYVTGEWSHHDVLAAVARGAAVVLTDHTNCERGYLPDYAARIAAALPGVEVVRSERDADPLRVV